MTSSFRQRDPYAMGSTNYLATGADLTDAMIKEQNNQIEDTKEFYTQMAELEKQRAEVDSIVDNMYGRNMAYAQEGARRTYLAANAAGREKLGLPASYGAPVMLPPSDRLTGALNIASQVASIATSITTGFPGLFPGPTPPLGPLGNPLSQFTSMSTGIPTGVFASASDIKLKENIKEVGVSPDGHKIYEFNYKGFKDRWRGAMAQDVVKKNPMAVGIRDGYLTIDYSKIDVNMELV